jgi:hypothetical protein
MRSSLFDYVNPQITVYLGHYATSPMNVPAADAVDNSSSKPPGIAFSTVSKSQQDVRFASRTLTPILNETTVSKPPHNSPVIPLGESNHTPDTPLEGSHSCDKNSALGSNPLLSTLVQPIKSSAQLGMVYQLFMAL